MKHQIARRVLTILLAAVALFDVAEGVLVLTGVCAPPATYQGTRFVDATVPMLLVAIVVGGSSLVAAATLYVRHPSGVYLAGAAGALMVAWEIVDEAVAQQFATIFVVVGLTVIALAEYLWTTDIQGQQLPARSHEVIRIALVVVEAIIAVSAFEGGRALLRGDYNQYVSVTWLEGTPFVDYTVPSLVLMIVVGGSALLAAATAFLHREWAVLDSMLAGLIMVGFLVVEAVCLDGAAGSALPMVLALQLFYLVLGVAIFGLAGFLWLREFPGHRFDVRHATHA